MSASNAPTNPPTSPEPERLGLSATQILASGLAAISATVVASFFGVAGTVIGAALGSVVSVVGSAVYGYSLRRTHSRVRQTLDLAVAQRFATDKTKVFADTADAAAGADGAGAARSVPTAKARWRISPSRLALLAGGLFVIVIAVTSGFELLSGQPLSATITGKHGAGLSIGGGTSQKAHPSQSSTPTPSPSHSAPASVSGHASPSTTVTVTVTPSASSSPTAASPATSSTPSQGASSSVPAPSSPPSASPTPSG